MIIITKKDKEIIDNLKAKINELQSIIKQKENNNLGNNFSSNLKYAKKKIVNNKTNNLVALDIDCINTNQIIDGYLGNMKNNSIRSMTNINNIFCNTIEDKIKDRIDNNNIEKGKELQNMSLTLKRLNSTNKNFEAASKRYESLKNGYKNINGNNINVNPLNNNINESKNTKNNINIINNDSVERNSISKKILEKTHKNILGNKEIINDRLIFSPQANRTSVGFGLKKLSIKLNNTPKETVKITKKIYENKTNLNKKMGYSKTTLNNLTNSLNNNLKNESNQNSYSSNANNNNNIKQNINNIKTAKEKQFKKQNTNQEIYNPNKISKKIVQKSKKNEKNDIFSSKNNNILLNKPLKISKKNENETNLNNSTNNSKKIKNFNNKTISKDNISRNFSIKSADKKNITDNNIVNIKNYNSLINISKKNKISDEYNFTIPKKYLNTEYKLIKSLKTDDKIINLYTNDKK